MRLMPENKAGAAGERCPHCRRPVGSGVEQCRPSPMGWWCWARGLVVDPSMLVVPAPDPVGAAEQAAIEEWAARIADAEKRVDERLAKFTVTEIAEGMRRREAAEVDAPPARTFMGSVGVWLRESTDGRVAAQEALTRLEDATKARKTALARLASARVELHRLQDRREFDRQAARRLDDIDAGRVKGTLQEA